MPKRRKDVILFDAPPVISAWGSAGGKKEGEGPLASAFDYLTQDAAFADENCANWEQAESMLQQKAAVMVEHAPYSPAKGVASVRSV